MRINEVRVFEAKAKMSGVDDKEESRGKAKNHNLGAVDVMMQLKGGKKTNPRPSDSTGPATSASAMSSAAPLSSSSSSVPAATKPSVYSEHRRIFGYQPSKVYSSKLAFKGKGKGKNLSCKSSSYIDVNY